jgi:hypothetical protein
MNKTNLNTFLWIKYSLNFTNYLFRLVLKNSRINVIKSNENENYARSIGDKRKLTNFLKTQN